MKTFPLHQIAILLLALLPQMSWALGSSEGADRMYVHSIMEVTAITSNRPAIEHFAQVYGVNPLAMMVILERQARGYGTGDRIQDVLASAGYLGYLPFNADSTALDYFRQTQREDEERLNCNWPNPRRNMRTHWIFASLGPGQIQTYTAMTLMDLVRRTTHRQVDGNSPEAVATWISSDAGGIEILAAELAWIKGAFLRFCGVDVSSQYGLIWFLHNRGNVMYRAARAQQSGCVTDSQNHLLVQGYHFGEESQTCENIAAAWNRRY